MMRLLLVCAIALLSVTAALEPPGEDDPADVRFDGFDSKKDMNSQERKEYRHRRFHVFRLKKMVQQAFKCARCNGLGTVPEKHMGGTRNRFATIVNVTCPECGGSKLLLSKSAHDALAEYYRERTRFQGIYRFDAPLDTGLERWLMNAVTSVETVRRLNIDGYGRLQSGAGNIGDMYLIAVEAFHLTAIKEQFVVQAYLKLEDGCSRMNLMVVFDERPAGITEGMRFLVLAHDEGEVIYEALLGKRTARCLTAIDVKPFNSTAKLPWDW